MAVRFTQPWGMSIYEHKCFTRQCSDAFEVYGGIFNYRFIRNLRLRQPVKEFRKSVSRPIWQR